jgi:hypothetical protein
MQGDQIHIEKRQERQTGNKSRHRHHVQVTEQSAAWQYKEMCFRSERSETMNPRGERKKTESRQRVQREKYNEGKVC